MPPSHECDKAALTAKAQVPHAPPPPPPPAGCGGRRCLAYTLRWFKRTLPEQSLPVARFIQCVEARQPRNNWGPWGAGKVMRGEGLLYGPH